jgi:hypothetical protein
MSSENNNSASWELPPESLQKASAALEDYLAARSRDHLDSQASVTDMNTAMATAVAQEFSKVGIDVNKLESVGQDNFAQCRRLIEEYRDRTARDDSNTATPGKEARRTVPYVSLKVPEGAAERPLDSMFFFRTAPFDVALLSVQPSDTPAFWEGRADPNTGNVDWNLGSNPNAGVNATISATAGIWLVPMVNNEISPFPGTATVQMNTSALQALGFASAQLFGNAVATSSVGYIVQEFDQSVNPLGIAQENYDDEFDLSVTFGQTQRKTIRVPSTQQNFTFSTVGTHIYLISFWLLGSIQAGVSGGLWGSAANTDTRTVLTSIAGVWNPADVATVPDVINLSPVQAKAMIEVAGFQYLESGDPQPGDFAPYVEEQDPSGGTLALSGSFVSVLVAVPTGREAR